LPIALARFATTAKITAINRLPPLRRLVTLMAFMHCLKTSAHDDQFESNSVGQSDAHWDGIKVRSLFSNGSGVSREVHAPF